MVVDRLSLIYDLVHAKLGHQTSLDIFSQKDQVKKIHDQLLKAKFNDY